MRFAYNCGNEKMVATIISSIFGGEVGVGCDGGVWVGVCGSEFGESLADDDVWVGFGILRPSSVASFSVPTPLLDFCG